MDQAFGLYPRQIRPDWRLSRIHMKLIGYLPRVHKRLLLITSAGSSAFAGIPGFGSSSVLVLSADFVLWNSAKEAVENGGC
jgi:hypothetical protein